MSHVQVSIQFLVDYHKHDGGTKKLLKIPPAKRQAFLEKCSNDLHGGKLAQFIALCQGPFRPILAYQSGTANPSSDLIRTTVMDALTAYNEAGFPFEFEIFDEVHDHETEAVAVETEPACIQWVWVDGQLVKRYNYDLRVTSGTPTTEGELTAHYRMALGYVTAIPVTVEVDDESVIPSNGPLSTDRLSAPTSGNRRTTKTSPA